MAKRAKKKTAKKKTAKKKTAKKKTARKKTAKKKTAKKKTAKKKTAKKKAAKRDAKRLPAPSPERRKRRAPSPKKRKRTMRKPALEARDAKVETSSPSLPAHGPETQNKVDALLYKVYTQAAQHVQSQKDSAPLGSPEVYQEAILGLARALKRWERRKGGETGGDN